MKPGDFIKALNHLREWETDHNRGTERYLTAPGEVGLLLNVWRVGAGMGRTRMRVFMAGKARWFTCKTSNLPFNWTVVPTSGSS